MQIVFLGATGVIAMLPGGVGSLELVVLFAVILMLFGPERLPEIARKLGRITEQIRQAAALFLHNIQAMDESGPADAGPRSVKPGEPGTTNVESVVDGPSPVKQAHDRECTSETVRQAEASDESAR